MVLTEDMVETLRMGFKSIRESELKIEELKETIKTYSDSIRDTFKSLYEKLDIDEKDSDGKKGVRDGYKEYVKELENPLWAEGKDVVYTFLKEDDFLTGSKLHD